MPFTLRRGNDRLSQLNDQYRALAKGSQGQPAGAGNNRAVSTATASRFLNAPGRMGR